MDLPRAPSLRLDGRRALVTGAGRGIGLAPAATLPEAGAAETLAARTSGEIEAGAQAIRAPGETTEAAVLDVADLGAAAAFFEARPAFDILVNNVGTSRPKPMQEVEDADCDAVLDLNVKSAFFVAQRVRAPHDRSRQGRQSHSYRAADGPCRRPQPALYCGPKWALDGMSKAFALDLAGHGIRSNTVAPTFIETPMTRPSFEKPAFKDSVFAKIKLGRLGQVEDLMGVTVFLASEAGALVTGTALVIDGGWTAD